MRQLSDAEAITLTAARALGEHLQVNRCAYATVEEDEDTFELTGNYTDGVESIVGRYTFRQFGEECLRLMRAGEPYVVDDSDLDPRIAVAERPSYKMTSIRAVICVPILKEGRFVAAMAVHPRLLERGTLTKWRSCSGSRAVAGSRIERTRVTNELRESEHLFRALANSIANLAWMARPDGWIYWYNDQWYDYTGTTPADMEGWGWERVHDPVDASRGEGAVAARHRSRAHRSRWCSRCAALTGAFADFSHASIPCAIPADKWSIGLAPTRTSKASDERQRPMRSFVSVSESRGRTRNLPTAAKDEFLAMLGHELRNPFSPILTALQLMKLRGSDELERERTVIERQVSHLTRLVDDLLDVSRIARGKVELKEEIVEIARGRGDGDRDRQSAARAANAYPRRAASHERDSR